MSAGYIQLAAIGQQDAFLTGSPSVTYFQGMYSRNTPFVLEAYEIPFNGTQVNFGSQSICRIPFKGDIIRGLTLKINLETIGVGQMSLRNLDFIPKLQSMGSSSELRRRGLRTIHPTCNLCFSVNPIFL